ncbi:MAG: major facilitator superfamily 1 [Marmoricola sp.]|nr:major facilitator superfamily 1 [Marmoricola sp.]
MPDTATPARRRTAMALVSVAFVVAMLGTTLPTPLYPFLEARLGFGELTTTLVFAAYPVGVIAALLLSGHWSDQVGRKPMLFAGLVCSALTAAVFLLPSALPWLYVARVVSGLSAGIFTGTATAAIVDLASAEHKARAGLVAAATNTAGLGLGPLVAGALAQWAPHPLTLPFLVDLALIAVAAGCLLLAPETVRRVDSPHLRPQRVHVPGEVRPVFVGASIAGFAGFAVLGLFTAVSPAFLGTVLHHSSPLLVGAVVLLVFAASVAGQAFSLRLSTAAGLSVGCAALIAGMAVLSISLLLESMLFLVAGGLVAGFGQGLTFRAGLGSVGEVSPADQRGAISSAFFVVLYIGISLPVVGVGLAATAFGLVPAGVIFAVLVGVLAAVSLVLLVRRG